MTRRLISANPQDILKFTAQDLFNAVKASEGRVVMAETIVSSVPYVEDLTNAEIARACGADLILLNLLDVTAPQISGLWSQHTSLYASKPEISCTAGNAEVSAVPAKGADLVTCVRRLKELVACPVGVNLEPVSTSAQLMETGAYLAPGRLAKLENFKICEAAGIDFICLTGNPACGVDNAAIVEALRVAKSVYDGLIIAGKMHSSGVDETLIDASVVNSFIEAGADIILLPAPGTVPAFGESDLAALVRQVHAAGKLALSAIGTSQESADPEVIRTLALASKRAGVDIQHLGDGGYGGMAPCENIFTLSKTIRGLKHTLSRIARSVNR